MLELSLNEIVEITNGNLYGKNQCQTFNSVSTDTRKVSEGDVFIAFKGEHFNGNKYVLDAFDSGASLCIVDELHIDYNNIPSNKSLILVDNTEKALGKLAQFYIKKMNVTTIGVTGSCGKTSTKDMISAALSSKFKVLKTMGNFNNHLGLPLTILRLDSSYDVAILEMGMSHAKEIEYLAEIAKPNIVVITNIGLSHIENLGTQENILKAKMESTTYFDKTNVLIVNGDDAHLNSVSSELYPVVKVGTNDNFDFCAKNISLNSLSSSFEVLSDSLKGCCTLDLPGKHNIINYLLSIAVGKEMGLSLFDIEQGIKNIEKTSMRLDMLDVNGYTIINDCYNASPDSMKSAIEVQINLNKKRNIAVLGSMFELGEISNACHYDLGEYISSKNIDIVFTTGTYTEEYKHALKEKCLYFESKDDLISSLKKYVQPGDSILIKASRGAKFEDIYMSLLN